MESDGPAGAREPDRAVVVAVRREILSGVLPRGGRIIDEQLTRRFGISCRAPLREALRELAQQGWSSTCHGGARS
jgi:DNA-binding GntR family transcriptional regulator